MKIDAAAPEPVRGGPAPKKGRADERSESRRAKADSLGSSERGVRGGRRPTRCGDEVESFLGPLAKVLIDLATAATSQQKPSSTNDGQQGESTADGPRLAGGKAAVARTLKAFALALAEMDPTPARQCVAHPAATRGGPEAPAFDLPAMVDRAVVSAEARREGRSPEDGRGACVARSHASADRAATNSPVAEGDPQLSIDAPLDPEAPAPAPVAHQAASTAAEAALVGLYTSASTGSPLESGLQVSSHVASLHRDAAPGAAQAEGLPTIHEAAVLKTVSAGGEAARVEVQHPELGTIQLDLKLERGSMDLHAVTTSVSSAIALRASESALRTSVALAGVELRGMRVDVAGDPEKSAEVRKKRRGDKRPLDTEA